MQDNQFSMQEAMRMAESPAGQQLLAILKQSGGADLQKAMSSAASGNFDQAKSALSSLLADPQVAELLKQLGGSNGHNGR